MQSLAENTGEMRHQMHVHIAANKQLALSGRAV